MPVQISIPSALRSFVGGSSTVSVEGGTVKQALDNLTEQHAGLRRHLRDDQGKLRSFVNVYLGEEDIRFLPEKEQTALKDGDNLVLVPSIAGGAL